MSKRQADYLSSLLSDTAAPAESDPVAPSPTATAPAPRSDIPVKPTEGSRANGASPMTLLARESALARVATGEVRQVTQLMLDPARVRIWTGNPRHQATLNEDNCRELLDAILAEGGQKVPAIIRRVTGDTDHDYEVIAGSRRHWCISWLRANNYPDMMFLAQVHVLDDESAFRISDIENRARKDVSDFERARTYLAAIDLHYGGKQVRMAERLRLSKGWLSKMLTVGAMPDWAIAAFASPADIQMGPAYPLAQKIQSLESDGDRDALKTMQRHAKAITESQAKNANAGRSPIPASEVIRELVSVSVVDKSDERALIALPSGSGRTALSVMSSNRNGVSIRLHAGSGASTSELSALFQKALDELNRQGKGLK